MPDFQILLYNRQCQLLAQPVTNWTMIDVTQRFNEPGSGLFTVPGYSWIRDAVQPGGRVVVKWRPASDAPSEVLMAGPIEERLYERGDDGEHSGAGTLTVNFADDIAQLATRIVYPDPTLEPESWVNDRYTASGTAENLLRQLVLVNAGGGALTSRQIPLLTFGGLLSSTVGASVDDRLSVLTDVLRKLATDAGLGFRTSQNASGPYFECYVPTDRSTTVRYSFELGNIRYLSYREVAPTATTALVGGQGDGADRFVLARTYSPDESTWGRAETYVARAGGATMLELQEDGDDALEDARGTAQLTATTIDSSQQRFGVHYFLGDTVSVSPYTGEVLTAQVKTVHIQAWATAGELITPTIGDQGESTNSGLIRKLREIDKRVRYVERNTLPSTP
jgi:hypothetical protein